MYASLISLKDNIYHILVKFLIFWNNLHTIRSLFSFIVWHYLDCWNQFTIYHLGLKIRSFLILQTICTHWMQVLITFLEIPAPWSVHLCPLTDGDQRRVSMVEVFNSNLPSTPGKVTLQKQINVWFLDVNMILSFDTAHWESMSIDPFLLSSSLLLSVRTFWESSNSKPFLLWNL